MTIHDDGTATCDRCDDDIEFGYTIEPLGHLCQDCMDDLFPDGYDPDGDL